MNEPDTFTDGDLVAYLDGELGEAERRAVASRLAAEPDLQARLDRLAAGGRPFKDAFDLLFESAPIGRLQDGLASAIAAHGAAPTRRVRWIGAIAAALVVFVLGGAVGLLLPRVLDGSSGTGEQTAENWRGIVAEYLTLYTSETLADIPEDPALKADELARVSAKLGTALTEDKVRLAGLDLKRAQLFDLNGQPLAQIAYLSERDGPVAFCIIRNGEADAAPAFETRQGKNIVYWAKNGRAFMLIGKTPQPELETLASGLVARTS